MVGRRRVPALTSIGAIAVLGVGLAAADSAGQGTPVAESYFAEKVYPALHAAQCERCHGDNGVASESRLAFPDPDAGASRVTAFGLSLAEFVDRTDPERSLLLRKPTRRMKHTGGQRIKPGSEEEALLRDWVTYLARLPEDRLRLARERADRADRRGPGRPAVRRLTHGEYERTVRDLLGVQTPVTAGFPKEDFVNGFKNQQESQGVSPLQAEAYSAAAERLARAAFRGGGDPHGLIPRPPEVPDDPGSAEAFVRRFGLRAFRRPLTDAEARRYVAMLVGEARRAGHFYAGAAIVVEAMLQSPHFLFRVERGADGPDSQYETASRLSYLLWGTMPDDGLFATAAAGGLATAARVEAEARRMLNDPRARAALDEFLGQWLRFDRVLDATRDRRRFREFNAETAAAMVEETRRLFHHLVWGDRNFLEFFTADYTFVNVDLARLYGLPAPAEDFARVDYPPDSGRSGVLGHGSFLVATSKPAETSPTARGLFVRNQFLGQEVPPPPAGVNTMLPAVTEDAPMTNRQRLALHLNSESCAGCHRLIDPIGLGFERFNAVGAYEPKMVLRFAGGRGGDARGRPPVVKELDLDTSGSIQGVEGSEFSTPRELGRRLAESPACHRALVKQVFRFAFGRQESEADQPVIDALLARFRDSGFRFRELLVALVTSELFLQKGSG